MRVFPVALEQDALLALRARRLCARFLPRIFYDLTFQTHITRTFTLLVKRSGLCFRWVKIKWGIAVRLSLVCCFAFSFCCSPLLGFHYREHPLPVCAYITFRCVFSIIYLKQIALFTIAIYTLCKKHSMKDVFYGLYNSDRSG